MTQIDLDIILLMILIPGFITALHIAIKSYLAYRKWKKSN